VGCFFACFRVRWANPSKDYSLDGNLALAKGYIPLLGYNLSAVAEKKQKKKETERKQKEKETEKKI